MKKLLTILLLLAFVVQLVPASALRVQSDSFWLMNIPEDKESDKEEKKSRGPEGLTLAAFRPHVSAFLSTCPDDLRPPPFLSEPLPPPDFCF